MTLKQKYLLGIATQLPASYAWALVWHLLPPLLTGGTNAVFFVGWEWWMFPTWCWANALYAGLWPFNIRRVINHTPY